MQSRGISSLSLFAILDNVLLILSIVDDDVSLSGIDLIKLKIP